MIFAPTNRRIIRPGDKPSFEHTQRYGLIKGHWANVNCVARWLFNEGSGIKVYDLSGNNNTGAIIDGTWQVGKFGSTILFNDASTVVNYGDILDIGTGDFSYGIWFKANWIAASEFHSLISKSKAAGGAGRYYLIFNGGNILTNLETSVADVTISTSETPYLDGNWHFAFVTIRRIGNITFYIDAVFIGAIGISPEAADDYNTAFLLGVGAYQAADGLSFTQGWFDGLLDVPMFYNRALTAGEVAQVSREPFLGIEKRTAPVYFFVPTGGVVYQELNLTVSADASVLESDTQQMVETGKEVSADASVSKTDTQQMRETGKEISADASVSCTDLKVVFELNLTVTADGSVVATEAHTMIETGKSVTAVASPAVLDTQAMVETELDVSAEGSVSCTDTMGLLAHIAAFMILRQCTT